MKGRLDIMTNPAAIPCEEFSSACFDRIFTTKDVIEELDVLSMDETHATFVFTGSFRMTSNALHVGSKMITEHLCMYGNCINALSSTNRRFLEDHDIATDYCSPNPLLARALGFDEEEAQLLIYHHNTCHMPIRLKVAGYDTVSGRKLEAACVTAHFVTGMEEAIKDEEAVALLADYLLDNEYAVSSLELMEEFENLENALENVVLSNVAKTYGESANEDDPWEQLEFALAYELAAEYLSSIKYVALQAYAVLHDKYEASDFILAETSFTFGLDADGIICITGEVATMNNSLIVNKADFIETKKFVQCHLVPLMQHYETHGEDSEVPDSVLDEISDLVFFVTEGLCGDMEFELYIN